MDGKDLPGYSSNDTKIKFLAIAFKRLRHRLVVVAIIIFLLGLLISHPNPIIEYCVPVPPPSPDIPAAVADVLNGPGQLYDKQFCKSGDYPLMRGTHLTAYDLQAHEIEELGVLIVVLMLTPLLFIAALEYNRSHSKKA